MTNQPRHDPETEQPHDRQAALQLRLESAFPPAFPRDADPEKSIQWIAANIDKGMCRIYAVHLNESLDEEGHKRLLERVRPRIDDPQLLEALNENLTAPAQPDQTAPESLAPVLADIALEGIDQILQQAKALGREGNFLHVQCTRAGNELIVLADQDSRYEWILPAVKKRLREELANLHYEPAAIETQSLDLSCGHRLRFLDFELRLVRDRHGEAKARYRLVAKSKRRYAQKARAGLLGRYLPPRFLQPCLKWIARKRSWQIVERAYGKANAVQVGWRHLPITLLPVLMLLFGWLSPVALLCFAAIPVCNWRWIVQVVRAAYDKAHAIQVSWRHLPVTLLPVLMFLFGWRSLVPWLDVVVIFACNWHWALGLLRWAGRHKLDMAMGAVVLAALAFLSPVLRDIYANRPREVASSSLPPGFYRGEYHGPSWWNGEPAPAVYYGLYVPPHLQGKKGPFPLIVFLHGFGERYKTRLFKAGLPLAIANRFGTSLPNGRFPFIAFFPIDKTGRWEAGSAEVEDAIRALDYVIARHRIDPSRVYLTGLSAGGSGVWSLAEAYPDKWAAVAPVSSSVSPDVQKVKHIPAWIFHGAKDQQAPVDRERYLVKQLKEAKADVRYTELPKRGHFIWDVAYNPKALYQWLASKKKD